MGTRDVALANLAKADPEKRKLASSGPTSEEGKKIASQNNVKHGFYMRDFFNCKPCPLAEHCKRRGELKDEAGIERCAFEVDKFDRLMELAKKENFTEFDLEFFDDVIWTKLESARARAYLNEDGLKVKSYIKDSNTGQVFPIDSCHVLKRDRGLADKSIREWLKAFNLRRDQREILPQKFDIALRLMDSDSSETAKQILPE